jgi:hypothetical protein
MESNSGNDSMIRMVKRKVEVIERLTAMPSFNMFQSVITSLRGTKTLCALHVIRDDKVILYSRFMKYLTLNVSGQCSDRSRKLYIGWRVRFLVGGPGFHLQMK